MGFNAEITSPSSLGDIGEYLPQPSITVADNAVRVLRVCVSSGAGRMAILHVQVADIGFHHKPRRQWVMAALYEIGRIVDKGETFIIYILHKVNTAIRSVAINAALVFMVQQNIPLLCEVNKRTQTLDHLIATKGIFSIGNVKRKNAHHIRM